MNHNYLYEHKYATNLATLITTWRLVRSGAIVIQQYFIIFTDFKIHTKKICTGYKRVVIFHVLQMESLITSFPIGFVPLVPCLL